MDTKQALLRKLPAIGIILEQPQLKEMAETFNHAVLAEAAAEAVQVVRENIKAGLTEIPSLDLIVDLVIKRAREKARPSLRRVINATGIVLHTNMGRAVLARQAVQAVCEVAASYSNLELDLGTGERGTRYAHVEELLCRLTGAEAGIVVNNNAAAVLLVLSTLAKGKEAVVSRGQLVEIGGSFRIPDVMAQSGATLVEVGSTNKTRLGDYERALTDNTGLLVRVHTSNYKIIGFTEEVSAVDLVQLGRQKGIPVFEDLGSGVLVDFAGYGVAHEPTVRETVAAGVDVVTCSGDKLFGGPQAGIIVGSRDLIARLKKNPLTRALRVDKFTLAAMEATLRLYFDEGRAVRDIPTLGMITMSRDELKRRAKRLAAMIKKRLGSGARVEIIEGNSQVGGGALPGENLPTFLVSLNPQEVSVNNLEEKLRQADPPVLARIQRELVLFDPRTLLDGDDSILARHLETILIKG